MREKLLNSTKESRPSVAGVCWRSLLCGRSASALFFRRKDASQQSFLAASFGRKRKGASTMGALLMLVAWLEAGLAVGQTMTLSDSTKPVTAPDGSKVIVVDRIFRVIDGDVQRYPSRLLVRVVDRGGTQTRQRRIDASQVRLLNPPRWIDNRWAAFTYNISKNANGVVYVDTETGEALQLEFVQLRRRLAATDTVDMELTSFDVTEYTNEVVHISNITRRSRSVFPLFLRPLPPYDTSPFPWVFVEQVRTALRAYREFLRQHNLRAINVEEASESFAPEEKFLAALACIDGHPAALICPMEAESPAAALERTRFAKLDPEIELACLAESNATGDDQRTTTTLEDEGEGLGRFREYRFTTRWRDDNTALVEQEIFESEEQEPRREVLYALTVDGNLEKLATPHTSSETSAPLSMSNPDENVAETSDGLTLTKPSASELSTASQSLVQTEQKLPETTATPPPTTPAPKQLSSTPRTNARAPGRSASPTPKQAGPQRPQAASTPKRKTRTSR